jgi:hypothetical protein
MRGAMTVRFESPNIPLYQVGCALCAFCDASPVSLRRKAGACPQGAWRRPRPVHPRPDVLDTRQQVRTKATLVHTGISARRYDAWQQLNRIMLAYYEDLRLWDFLPQEARYFQAIDARHADIEKDQVGLELSCFQKSLPAIRGFAADLPVRLG